MEINASVHTYNTYGGQKSISMAATYFELDIKDFGDAIKELEIHLYFKGGKIRKTLESLFEQYHGYLEELPSTKFYRKKHRFELNFLSELGDANLVSGYDPPELNLFLNSAKEIASKLPAMHSKIKKTDDFDFAGFSQHIADKLSQLPGNEEEFTLLQKKIEAHRKMKLEAMDEWDELGIDWIDYHPKAREILDSPYYWDCVDDFAPNGNDTGADVLIDYQDWRKKNKTKSGMVLFEKIMKDWEVTLPIVEGDEFSRDTYEEAIIGLAFAQLKVDGGCESKIGDLAIEAIQSVHKRISTFHKDWDLYDERVKTLQRMEQKLKLVN